MYDCESKNQNHWNERLGIWIKVIMQLIFITEIVLHVRFRK